MSLGLQLKGNIVKEKNESRAAICIVYGVIGACLY